MGSLITRGLYRRGSALDRDPMVRADSSLAGSREVIQVSVRNVIAIITSEPTMETIPPNGSSVRKIGAGGAADSRSSVKTTLNAR